MNRAFPEGARFENRGRLGAGAFGMVFRAWDTEWKSDVALKVLSNVQHWALYRFKTEFRSILEVRHPNLVQVHELFGEGDRWYFTMERIDGIDPIRWLSSDAVLDATFDTLADPTLWEVSSSPEGIEADGHADEIRHVFRQIALGLTALHEVSLVHRDLKPQNVLVDDEGHVKLLDFGLAEFFDESSSSGRAGTPAYMAPEVWKGGQIGPAVDWYSFGVMLHQALCGTLPPRGGPIRVDDPALDELAALCGRLLESDPDKRATGADVLAALGGEVSAPLKEVLVGRDELLEQLEAHAERSRTGPVVVLLRGESGVGKTAVAQKLLGGLRRRHDARVLAGRCYEQMSVPLRALDGLVDALARALSELTDAELEALRPAWARELVHVFAVLGALAPDEGEIPPDPVEVRSRAFVALRQVLASLAEQTHLALWIDDLQWGDVASARVLAELLLAEDAPRMLLLGTCRTDEGTGFLDAWSTLKGRHFVHTVTVPPLSGEHTLELARVLRPEASQTELDALVQEARGNPMFVELLSAGAVSISGALEARMAGLAESERELLEVIAVAGRPMPKSVLLGALTGPGAPNDLESLRLGRLVRTRDVHGEPAAVSYHDRIREGALELMPATRVKQANLGLARAMVAVGMDDPGQVALRFAAADHIQDASEHAEVAADRAQHALKFDLAVRFHKLVLSTPELAPKRAENASAQCAEALMQLGRAAEAAPLCEDVARFQGDSPNWRRLAAEQWIVSGHHDRGVQALRQVCEAGDLWWPGGTASIGLGILGGLLKLRWADRKLPTSPPESIPEELSWKVTLAWSCCRALISSDQTRGLYYLLKGLLLSIEARDPIPTARFGLLFYANLAMRDMAWGVDRFNQCRDIAMASGEPYLRALAIQQHGYVLHSTGVLPQAVADYLEGLAIFEGECRGVGWEVTATRQNTFDAMLWVGDLPQMTSFIEESRLRAHKLKDEQARCAVLTYDAFLQMTRDEPDAAADGIEQVFAMTSQEGFSGWQLLASLRQLRLLLYTGQVEQAWTRLGPLWKRFTKEGLHQIPAFATHAIDLRAAITLSEFKRTGDVALAKQARGYIKSLATKGRGDWAAMGFQHRAALATIEGRDALADLKAAATTFDEAGLQLRAALCRAHLDQSSLDVANPARFLDAFAPGFA
jgi:eukaryotic-like serine/threonine-protein kinase